MPCLHSYIGFAITFLLTLSIYADADIPEVTTTTDIKIHLINKRGKETKSLILGAKRFAQTIVFKYTIGKAYRNYASWALEVSDPQDKQTFRMAFEGSLPPLLHWDGKFNAANRLEPDRKYYVRLILITPENEIFVSPWSDFSTKTRSTALLSKIPANTINLYIIPNGMLYGMIVKSGAGTDNVFPIFKFDGQVVWKHRHVGGLRVAVSSNFLISPLEFDTALYYSKIALYYRYQVMGRPVRRPNLPFIPDYVDPLITPTLKVRRYSKRVNFQIGAGMFLTTLRAADFQVDDALFRGLRGAMFSAQFDCPIVGPFRFRSQAEAGYSVFFGRALFGSLDFGVTYESIVDFSPGVHISTQFYTGKRSQSLDNSTRLNNFLLFTGFFIQAKI